jgi:alpha-ribazole phosphatase
MNLVLIKHGKTDYSLNGKRQGRTDLSLNLEGKKEITELKEKIKKDYKLCFSSPLKRTYETAVILFPEMKVIKNDLLIEYDFGELEGIPFSMPFENFPDNKIKEFNDMKFLMPNNGETFEDIVDRCINFLEFIKGNFQAQDNVAAVTHSTNIEIFKALANELPWYKYLGDSRNFQGFIELNI